MFKAFQKAAMMRLQNGVSRRQGTGGKKIADEKVQQPAGRKAAEAAPASGPTTAEPSLMALWPVSSQEYHPLVMPAALQPIDRPQGHSRQEAHEPGSVPAPRAGHFPIASAARGHNGAILNRSP
jgi:hypothetical protein